MTTSTSFSQMANNQSISLSSALRANTPPTKGQTTSRKFLTLSIFFLLSFFCTTHTWGADTWTLVTNVNDLAVDDEVVIVAKDYNYALSTTQNNNNRGQASVTKSHNTITFGSDVQVLTLKVGITSGTWAFYTGSSGYLYAASSGSNHLKTQTTNNANGSWNITIASTGVATIKATGTNSRNWLRYNSSNNPPIFSCYGSGQGDVCIYKKVTPVVPQTIDVTLHYKGISTTINNQTSPYTLPTTGDYVADACDGWKFAGWYGSEYAKSEIEPSYITQLTSTGAAYAVYSKTETTQGGGGTEVNITPSGLSDNKVTHNQSSYTITTAKNGGQTAPAYNAKDADVRIYAKGSITISNTTNITKIVFNVSAQGKKRLAPITASVGSIATQASGDATVTWTGEATSITFTVGEQAEYGSDGSGKAGQLCFTTITATTSGGGSSSTTYYHSTPDCGPTTYTVTTGTVENCTVKFSKTGEGEFIDTQLTGLEEGDYVHFTITPTSGYKLNGTPVVKDASNGDVECEEVDGIWFFEMPESNVTVSVSCVEIPKLATPTNLKVTNISCTGATLTWDNVANNNGYLLSVKNTSSSTTFNSNIAKDITSGSPTLNPGTTYTWKVTAKGDGTNYTNSEVADGGSFTTNYKITYNVKGGTWTACADGCVAGGEDFTICSTEPSKDGYNFVGWSTADDTEVEYQAGGTINNVSANTTLYAVWEQKKYTITFNTNGGTINEGNVETYTYGVGATLPTNVTKENHQFGGWFDNSNCTGTAVTTISTTATDNKVYWAKWNPAVYTITYKDQGGANFSGQHEAGYPTTHTYNTATTLKSASKEHYTFGGWYKESDCSETAVTTLGATDYTNNITLYAKWTAKTYTITFNAGTGECDTEPITTTNASGVTLPTASHTCTDWTFAGWWTEEVSSTNTSPGTFLNAGDTYNPTSDITLYAVYSTQEAGDAFTGYAKVTTTPDDWSGKYLFSTGTYTANGTYDSNGANGHLVREKYTPGNEEKADWEFTLAKVGNTGYSILFPDGSYYLGYASSTNFARSTTVVQSDNVAYLWSPSTSGITNVGDKTRIIKDGGSDFRPYVNDNPIVYLYKRIGGGTTTTYNSNPTCLVPVWEGATIDKTALAVNCGERSSMDGAAKITFSKDKIFGFSNPITIEASEGFLVSTSRTPNGNYQQSVSQSPLVGTEYPNTFNGKFVYVRAEAPAMSEENLSGTITIKNNNGETLQTFSVTADVTCTTYTLTLDDRGTKTTAEYYADASVPKPEDPTGVCTDPIHYEFDGWATSTVAGGSTTYTKVSFPYTMPAKATTLYAVYRYTEGNTDSDKFMSVDKEIGELVNGMDYVLTGYNTDDKEYALSCTQYESGKYKTKQIDVSESTTMYDEENPYYELTTTDNEIIWTITGDDENGYSFQNKSTGKYLNMEESSLVLNDNNPTKYTIEHYVEYDSESGKYVQYLDVIIQPSDDDSNYLSSYYKNSTAGVLFNLHNSSTLQLYLYKRAAATLYTTSPACGPMLEITSGKDIYVTSGFGTGRNTVIAQQTVEYRATRLKTQNGSAEGTAPDVKVAANGVTMGGVVTDKVKVEITQNKELIGDKYTITGTVTVQYTPTENNLQEEIQVQLAVDYNSEAKDNFTVHARSLPEEFVIVAKSSDKWYALNADMSSSKAQPANGQVTLNDLNNPTKADFAPCNTIYTFDGMVDGGNKEYMRFQGIDGKYLWAASEGNTGIQNYAKNTPAGNNKAYNWKLYTEDNITYQFGNANSSRQLTLSGEKFGMYASGVQDIRILPYEAKCIYNYAPTNLKVSVLKSTSVTLTWDAVPSATKYQYSTDATNWTDVGTEPTVTINGLTGGTEYIYYVRAYHEEAGVECIDYAEITFTTANCDDVPADITYSADLTSITVTWTAVSTNCTVRLYSDEACTSVVKFADELKGSVTFSQLDRNTTYYVRVFAEGTCASPIVEVNTKPVELDIVEWDTDKIFVDINTNEIVSVTLENEVSYGSGTGKKAEELFFSKYFEATGNVKLLALYNGTNQDIDLTQYSIKFSNKSKDITGITDVPYEYTVLLSEDIPEDRRTLKAGQELIIISYSNDGSDDKVKITNPDGTTSYVSPSDYEVLACAAENKKESGWDKYVRVTSPALNFSGNDAIALFKNGELIDIIGAGNNNYADMSNVVEKTANNTFMDAAGWYSANGYQITLDNTIGTTQNYALSTNRCLLIRRNDVVSGEDAVTRNTEDFVTLGGQYCEWMGYQIPNKDEACNGFMYVGKYDYSKYYTKFESMGYQEFDTNSRNSDGTITVPISGLNTQSCRNIKITVKDANGNVLKSQDYKVPIMITTDQETAYTDADKAQNAFYALQENLATVEVDGNGNPTGNKTNLTLEQVREICKTCDVVVRDNATLTKVTDGTTNDHPQVRNVYVYEGASIVIPDGDNHNYTINGLSLRRKGDVVASAQVQGTGKFVLPADEPVCLDLRVDANNWHWFTLPYNCNIADVTWVDGTPAKYNTDWFLMYYDGESRAASTNPYDNHWKVYEGTTIEAGKGYIVGITGDLAHPDYTFELRFPMAQDVLIDEQTRKTVPVNAWGVKSDNKPNNLGWNLVGNPYLNYYKTADEYSLAGLPLIKYTSSDLVVGEFYEEENGNIPFLVTPIDGGWYEYRQELASEVNMMPFTAYFVQVGDPNTHTNGQALNASFEASNRGKKSIVRRAPREVEEIEEPIIVRVELTNSKGESDKTSLVIDDRFTNEYEMNADFFKWFGDYYNYYTKPVLYTIGADQGKRAFNALNEELAKQPIPMGMYAAQAGNYTFSLNQQFDLSRVEEVWLYDATQSTYTNLMQSDYTFSTSKVNGAGRFSLSIKLAPKVATSIDNVTADKVWATTHTKQVIVNGLENGMHLWLYDATGKLLYNEPTSNYQHTYAVPQTGTYFVSVMNGNAKQTIKVVVE